MRTVLKIKPGREKVATLAAEVWLNLQRQLALIDMRIANEVRLSPTHRAAYLYGSRSYVVEKLQQSA